MAISLYSLIFGVTLAVIVKAEQSAAKCDANAARQPSANCGERTSHGLNVSQQQEAVKAFETLHQHSKVQWSDELATKAQAWVNQCNTSKPTCFNESGGGEIHKRSATSYDEPVNITSLILSNPQRPSNRMNFGNDPNWPPSNRMNFGNDPNWPPSNGMNFGNDPNWPPSNLMNFANDPNWPPSNGMNFGNAPNWPYPLNHFPTFPSLRNGSDTSTTTTTTTAVRNPDGSTSTVTNSYTFSSTFSSHSSSSSSRNKRQADSYLDRIGCGFVKYNRDRLFHQSLVCYYGSLSNNG